MIVGQKVVCLDDKFDPVIAQLYTALPVKDSVYVIRNVQVGCNAQHQPGEVCVYLIGLNNPKSGCPPFRERGFNGERFAPLEELQRKSRKDVSEPVHACGHIPANEREWLGQSCNNLG